MNRKNINFGNKNIKKTTFTIKTKKILNIDDIDVNKILISNIIHLNNLSRTMLTTLLDHYTYLFHKLLATLINLTKIK